MYNPEESAKAQAKLQEEKQLPEFAPKSGNCWSCNQNIYKPTVRSSNGSYFITGVTIDYASKHLITGCPHCNKSYCD